MVQAGRVLPSICGDIFSGACSITVFSWRQTLLCLRLHRIETQKRPPSCWVGSQDLKVCVTGGVVASVESRNLAFASRPQRAIKEAAVQSRGVFKPHPRQLFHVAHVHWHVPWGCRIFVLQKELACLQWPQGDCVRVFQQLSLQASLCPWMGLIISKFNICCSISGITESTLLPNGETPSIILTLNMLRDRAGTTFGVWETKKSLHWVEASLNKKMREILGWSSTIVG